MTESVDEGEPPRELVVDAKPAPGDASSGSGTGTFSNPLSQAQARELRDRLQRAGLLALHDVPFDVAAADVYGDLADED